MTAGDWLELGQMLRAGAREIRAYSDAPETNVIADSYVAMASYAETVAQRQHSRVEGPRDAARRAEAHDGSPHAFEGSPEEIFCRVCGGGRTGVQHNDNSQAI